MQRDWLTGADWRIVGRPIPIYLSQLECFLCHSLSQICKKQRQIKLRQEASEPSESSSSRRRTAGEIISGVLEATERSARAKCNYEQLGKTQVCQKSTSGRIADGNERVSNRTTFRDETCVCWLFLFYVPCATFTFLKLLWNNKSQRKIPKTPQRLLLMEIRKLKHASSSYEAVLTQVWFELNANISMLKMSTLTC